MPSSPVRIHNSSGTEQANVRHTADNQQVPESSSGENRGIQFRLGGTGGVALILLLIALASWFHQDFHDYESDDAYISYRYARNWAEGHGPVFNSNERVEGYTNFLLVAFLAGVHSLGGDIVTSARALGTVCCWGLLFITYRMLGTVLRRGRSVALWGSAAIALHTAIAVWARSGLETVPLAFVVVLAQYVFLREHRDHKCHWGSGTLFAVLALMRADGFLFLGVTVLFLAILRSGKRAWVTILIPFLVVFGPYFVWRWCYYGYPLPNSYYLKVGGDFYQQLRGLLYTYKFVRAFGGAFMLGLPLVLLVRRDPDRNHARLYLGGTALALAAYIVIVGGDHMPASRLFVPLVAPMTLLIVEAICEVSAALGAAGRISPRRRSQLAGCLLALVALSGFLPTLSPRQPPRSHVISSRLRVARWSMVGRWFREHVEPGTLLATKPAGAVPFFSNLPIVDMLGVTDEHIAHIDVPDMGHGRAGHEKRDFAYVLSRRPDIIFLYVKNLATDENLIRQPDGSQYTLRCASLGRGPRVTGKGEIAQTDFYLWYMARNAEPERGQ